jgi:outer membrane immunogenic protein
MDAPSMNKTRLSLTALAIAISAPAYAADLGRSVIRGPAPPAPYIDWTGFYLGGHAGFGWGNADYRFNSAGRYNFFAGDSVSHSMTGALAGGHIGYNWMWNNYVLGIEGSGTWSGVGSTVASPFFPTDTIRTRLDWFGTLTPRAGITFGNTMLYAKGGLAFGEITSRLQDPLTHVERSDTRVGWTIGAGLDWMLTPNWIVGIEGNYYDFGKVNVSETARLLGTNTPVAGQTTNHDVSVGMASVLGRVSYKLGNWGPIRARY